MAARAIPALGAGPAAQAPDNPVAQVFLEQQARIAELQRALQAKDLQLHTSAAQYEQQLRAMALELQGANQRVVQLQQTLGQRDGELRQLRENEALNRQQIAQGLREIEALTAQLALARQHVDLLTQRVRAQEAQMTQDRARVQQLEARMTEYDKEREERAIAAYTRRPDFFDSLQRTVDLTLSHGKAALGFLTTGTYQYQEGDKQ